MQVVYAAYNVAETGALWMHRSFRRKYPTPGTVLFQQNNTGPALFTWQGDVMYYIGIDPGISGAAVCIDHQRHLIDQIRFSKSTDSDVVEFFKEFGTDSFVVLEKVHSMPKQGVASTFKFGGAFRFVQGVMMGCGVSFELCSPQVWQKVLQVPPRKGKSETEHKRVLKNIACQLYNGQGILIVKENADALLIAEYCRQKYQR